MIGGTLLQQLGLPSVTGSAEQPCNCSEWLNAGRASTGEQVWQRVFDAAGRTGRILVTVAFDPDAGTARTMYAAVSLENDKLPRIPTAIRQEAASFKRTLESGRLLYA